MLLFGASVFIGLLAPASLAATLQRTLRLLQITAAALLLLSAIAWLVLETGFMGSGWEDAFKVDMVSTVLTQSDFGSVWIVHLVGVAAAFAMVWVPGQVAQRLVAFFSAVALASLGFIGHAAAHADVMGQLHRLNHALHLLSGGFWVGCLVPLLVCLLLLRRSEYRTDASRALRRFSSLGHVAVALVLLTGVFNSLLIFGGLPTDLTTPYTILLIVKIGLVTTMVGIAVFNRYVAVPRLSEGSSALRWITLGTVSEIGLGTIVIGLVSAFATFDPMPGMDT